MCPFDQPVFLIDIQGRERRGARERMAVVGQAGRKDAVLEPVGDLAAHADGAHRHVRARQTLGHRDDVGHDVPVIDGEPLARPAES